MLRARNEPRLFVSFSRGFPGNAIMPSGPGEVVRAGNESERVLGMGRAGVSYALRAGSGELITLLEHLRCEGINFADGCWCG